MFVAHHADQRLNGRIDEARHLAGLALDRSRERKERGYETQALRLLGEIAAREMPPDTALEAGAELSTAVVMLRAMNMNFWLPEAEAALAQAVASPVRRNA